MNAFLAVDFSALSGTARSWIVAGGIVLGSSLVGLLVERVLLSGLRKLAATTDFKLDDILISSLRGVARWGFLLLGIFAAIPVLPLPVSISSQVTTIARVVVMVFATLAMARFAGGVAAHYAHRFVPSSVSIAKNVVNVVVLTLGLLIIFQTMGIKVTAILTALGVGGLAVALALQDTLSNFFAGIQVLTSRQIRVGDYVQLEGGQEGFVHDISWRAASVKMLSNNIVIIPNTKLAQAIVTNYSLEDTDFSVRISLGVAYDSDLDQVERVTREVAREVSQRVEGAVKDFEPVVRFHTFGDSSIDLNVIVRCRDYRAQFVVRHEMVKALHKRYQREGIKIPFPIRTVIMRGESAPG